MALQFIGLAIGAASVALGAAQTFRGGVGGSSRKLRKEADESQYAQGVLDVRQATFNHMRRIAHVSSTFYARSRTPYTRAVQAHYAAILDPHFFKRGKGGQIHSSVGATDYNTRYRYYFENPVVTATQQGELHSRKDKRPSRGVTPKVPPGFVPELTDAERAGVVPLPAHARDPR